MFLVPRLLLAMSLPVLVFAQTQIELQQSKYRAPGAGAVNRSGASKLADIVSVRDYGAVGDGVTDDLPAINQAFAAAAQSGQRILFPAGTYGVSNTVLIPNKTQIYGIGRGDAGIVNTVIKALPSFPQGATVVQMGPAPGPDFGVQVTNMTIDGSALAGVCLSNTYSEELSYGKDLLLTNCGKAGLVVSSGAAQNSGPFENLEIYPGSGPTVNTNTVCIQVTGVVAFRGIRGVTCNPGTFYGSRPAVGLALDGGGYYADIHVEHAATAISLGSAAASADGMTVANGQFGPDVVIGVAITAPNGINNQNLSIGGMSCFGCTSLLTDAEMGTNITDESLGWYMIGNGAGGGKPMLSGNNGVGGRFYGPFFSFGTSSFGPGNSNTSAMMTLWDATPNTGVTSVIEFAGAGQGSSDMFEWRNQYDQVVALVGSDGRLQSGQLSALNNAVAIGNGGAAFANNAPIWWSSSSSWSGGTPDVGLARTAAGVLTVTNGGSGTASLNAQSIQLSPSGTQPGCSTSNRGSFWFVQSPSGTADHLQVCSKSASDSYSWTLIF
jgi:Pectate lyase superfamily protein